MLEEKQGGLDCMCVRVDNPWYAIDSVRQEVYPFDDANACLMERDGCAPLFRDYRLANDR